MSHGTSPVVRYCFQNRFARATFSCDIAAQYRAGSGLGVSVLLRQAEVFEGRAQVFVGRCEYCLARREPEGVYVLRRERRPASFSSPERMDRNEHPIASFDEALRFEPKVNEGFKSRLQPLRQA